MNMEMTTGIIVGLIILSFSLCYKIAQLSHRLKLSDKENEDIGNKYAKSESDLEKRYHQEMAQLAGQQAMNKMNSASESDS